jgi:carboxymethylenebutenolidase
MQEELPPMCFDLDSSPPITPVAGAIADQKSLELKASDGATFRAFHAVPATPTGKGIVILPDVRGLHHYYEELALRFAEIGVEAVAIDYFGRTAGIGDRGDDFDYGPHVAQTTWAGLSADITAAVDYLRSDPTAGSAANTRSDPVALGIETDTGLEVFATGFCMGGRVAFLSGTLGLDLAGVIGFYGWPSGPARNDTPAPVEMVGQIDCPVLGIFGGADQNIPVSMVQAFRDALAAANVEHEVVVEPDAPHSFFDRKAADFRAASSDAWQRVLTFVAANSA